MTDDAYSTHIKSVFGEFRPPETCKCGCANATSCDPSCHTTVTSLVPDSTQVEGFVRRELPGTIPSICLNVRMYCTVDRIPLIFLCVFHVGTIRLRENILCTAKKILFLCIFHTGTILRYAPLRFIIIGTVQSTLYHTNHHE